MSDESRRAARRNRREVERLAANVAEIERLYRRGLRPDLACAFHRGRPWFFADRGGRAASLAVALELLAPVLPARADVERVARSLGAVVLFVEVERCHAAGERRLREEADRAARSSRALARELRFAGALVSTRAAMREALAECRRLLAFRRSARPGSEARGEAELRELREARRRGARREARRESRERRRRRGERGRKS